MKRICIIFNPAAKGDKARRFGQRLSELSGACVFKATTAPGAGRVLAREAVEEGFAVVAAAGGDGTVNEVLNGLGDAPEGFARAVLGIIPLGTSNVFAREMRIPFELSACWEVLLRGQTASVDLVRVGHRLRGESIERWMVQVAGAGLDARAVELVDWGLKKRVGYLAYVAAGLRALCESQPSITVQAGETRVVGELVLLGNGRLYGGPFALFPRADPRDGQLDARVLPRVTWPIALACGFKVLTRRFERMGQAVDLRAARIELRSDQRVALQIDGELAGELPAWLEVAPGKLRVVVP
jgi:diacylglycerol kinase (ATP)